jgi:hypothetical protein
MQDRTPGSRTQIGETRTLVGSTSPSRSVAQALMAYLCAWSMTEKVRLHAVELAFGWARVARRVVYWVRQTTPGVPGQPPDPQ